MLIGEQDGTAQDEELLAIENVDDLSPQVLGHVMDTALAQGALDCYFTPVLMKKSRPATLISVLCRPADREVMSNLLFRETTTLGLRTYPVVRRALDREVVTVETRYGPIDVKVARLNGGVVNEMPEYEQCRAAAARCNVALRVVEDETRLALAQMKGKESCV